MLNFENLGKFKFHGIGTFDIPEIKAEKYERTQFIPFNYVMRERRKSGKSVHFFVDDYQFTRCWNQPDRYTDLLRGFDCVLSPDFSTYTDMPVSMQIYNHYRKHWLGAYWQLHGIKVIPTISWSDERSFDWCFDGEPHNCVVAVSSVGCMSTKESKRLFLRGYEEMMKRLDPTQIIFYGKVPEECDWNVIRIEPYYNLIVERRMKNGRKRIK